MTSESQASRRSLLATVFTGAVLGGIWGAAFPLFATENRPSMAVVGHKGAQIILLDTSEARALVLAGDPDDALIASLPAMMTLFRQRIDLLVATSWVLLRVAGEVHERWKIPHALSLESRPGLEVPSIATTSVSGTVSVSLDADIQLEVVVSHRGEWNARAPSSSSVPWSAAIRHPGGVTVITPDIESLDASPYTAGTLLISPELPSGALLDRGSYGAYACNYDSDGLEDNPVASLLLTRIYPQDIARFVLHDGGVGLPPWTHQP